MDGMGRRNVPVIFLRYHLPSPVKNAKPVFEGFEEGIYRRAGTVGLHPVWLTPA